MPFKSDAQRRFLYSQKPEIAREFAKKTPKGKSLPERVTSTDKAQRALQRMV